MATAPVGFSGMLSHTIRESPAAGAYNNIRWGFCRLLLGPQIAANLFVASYHFGRFFPSLPRFYFPAQRIVHLWVTMVLGWVYFLWPPWHGIAFCISHVFSGKGNGSQSGTVSLGPGCRCRCHLRSV